MREAILLSIQFVCLLADLADARRGFSEFACVCDSWGIYKAAPKLASLPPFLSSYLPCWDSGDHDGLGSKRHPCIAQRGGSFL